MSKCMSKNKKIETELVLCMGEADTFLQVPFVLGEPTFFVENVTIDLQDLELNLTNGECCNSIIFNGNLLINVIYKVYSTPATTAPFAADGFPTIDNAVRHQTRLVPVAGCIPIECQKFNKCDNVFAKLVNVCITENHVFTNPVAATVDTVIPAFNGLNEQICFNIKAKVVTDEIITISLKNNKDNCKCSEHEECFNDYNDCCKCQKYENHFDEKDCCNCSNDDKCFEDNNWCKFPEC